MTTTAAPHTPYVLIGSQHSLFTGKLRAYLQWRQLPFLELTASGEVYRQIILPRTGLCVQCTARLPGWSRRHVSSVHAALPQ
jgi:hypothetical protein